MSRYLLIAVTRSVQQRGGFRRVLSSSRLNQSKGVLFCEPYSNSEGRFKQSQTIFPTTHGQWLLGVKVLFDQLHGVSFQEKLNV